MHSFGVKITDGGMYGIDETFSVFASDIVEAAIKSYDLLNTLQENIRKAADEDEDFQRLDGIIRISYISDEGELTGGEVAPSDTWVREFADQMTARIKKFLC